MAETLQQYDRQEESEIPSGRPAIYPWDDWFDGQIWRLTRGEDYEIPTSGMMSYIRKMAAEREFDTSVYIHDDNKIVIKPRE